MSDRHCCKPSNSEQSSIMVNWKVWPNKWSNCLVVYVKYNGEQVWDVDMNLPKTPHVYNGANSN